MNALRLLCYIGIHAWAETPGNGAPRRRQGKDGIWYFQTTRRQLCMRCPKAWDEAGGYWHVDQLRMRDEDIKIVNARLRVLIGDR